MELWGRLATSQLEPLWTRSRSEDERKSDEVGGTSGYERSKEHDDETPDAERGHAHEDVGAPGSSSSSSSPPSNSSGPCCPAHTCSSSLSSCSPSRSSSARRPPAALVLMLRHPPPTRADLQVPAALLRAVRGHT